MSVEEWQIAGISLRGQIIWNLDRCPDPAWPVRDLGGWHLLNPLVDIGMMPVEMGVFLPENQFFFTTQTLAIARRGSPRDSKAVTEGWEDEAALFRKLLRALRWLSRQPALPLQGAARWRCSQAQLPEPSYTAVHSSSIGTTGERLLVNEYMLGVAITTLHLRELCDGEDMDSIPVHHELLLDGLLAFEQEDYRRALLYAAIAVECAARATMEAAYAELRKRESPALPYRVLQIAVDADTAILKDPVAHWLLQDPKMLELVHEVSLYLTNRSLQHQRPTLYRDLTSLYKTRNKIVHRGFLDGEKGTLSVDRSGAECGLDVAIEVLEWLGAGRGFVRQHFGMRSVRVANEEQ